MKLHGVKGEICGMANQTVFQRYELKYMLTLEQKEKMLKIMEPYMALDKYGRTIIRNIYFDTDNYRLIRHSIEKTAYKEKLRIRSYSQAGPDSEVFVELKKKYKHIVYKRRVAIPEIKAMEWVCDQKHCEKENQISEEIDYFIRYYENLHPAAFISYEREAYYSKDGTDFRVTFDDHILFRENDLSLEAEIEAEGDGMSASANMLINDGTFGIVSGGGSVNATKQTSDSWGGFMGGGMGGRRPGGSRNSFQPESQLSSSESEDSSTSIKGIKSTGDMQIDNGAFTIDSADDAVHSNASIIINGGSFQIASGDDGFHADETLTIASGAIDITESYEGLEALDIIVSGGEIKLAASDDGLNAAGGTDSSGTEGPRGKDQFGGRGGGMGGMSSSSNGSILITGGNLYVNASGDGIDANGSLEISGGYTVVVGPTQGDTATLDYDTSAVITGGTFIGTGASGMAQTFSDSEQGVVAVSVGNCAAGTTIELQDRDGNTITSYVPELDFGVVILSNPDVVKGDTYRIIVGDASGEFEAN